MLSDFASIRPNCPYCGSCLTGQLLKIRIKNIFQTGCPGCRQVVFLDNEWNIVEDYYINNKGDKAPG